MAISPQQLTIYLYSAHRAVIFAISQLSCWDNDAFSSKVACFPHPTLVCDINVTYTPLKSTFIGLQSVADSTCSRGSQICENSERVRSYSISRSYKVIGLNVKRKSKNLCDFLLVINSNFGGISSQKKMNLGLAKMQFPAVLPPSLFLCKFGRIARPMFSKIGEVRTPVPDPRGSASGTRSNTCVIEMRLCVCVWGGGRAG